MNRAISNIFELLPEKINNELFENIVSGENIKIERIVSKGHSTPKLEWYDQSDNEWVIVLKGEAKIEFEHQTPIHLVAGSYLNIPSHTRHRVTWTAPDTETIWLAIHYK